MMVKDSWDQPLAAVLEKYGACSEAVVWAAPYTTAAAGWEACPKPQWMLWALEVAGFCDQSLVRQVGCACVRETPLSDGRKVWDLLTDERSRAAVEVAERFAVGKANAKELASASVAAWSAVRGAESSAAWSAVSFAAATRGAAWSTAATAAKGAVAAAAWEAAWSAASSAAWGAEMEAAWCTASSAAWAAQCAIIRRIIGNPFAARAHGC